MRFNYGYEKKKFDKEWKKLRKEYEAAGMNADAIEAMYRFDLETFRAERSYCKHTQYLPVERADQDEETGDMSPFMKQFGERMCVEAPIVDPDRRYGWIDELDDEDIVKAVRELSHKDIDIITEVVYEGYSQVETAIRLGVTKQYVNKRLIRLNKVLKKIKGAG